LIFLLLTELFLAAQSLAYNQPTAPQAYHSLRNAPAFLLAADPPTGSTPPGRFLSLSGITYDPGDLRELQQIFGNNLSEKALYNLIVATKEKEVLFFNLPLGYGLYSVDGYDGGLLPLKQFVTLQKLFLPPNNLSIDGRLREKLRFVPPGRLLSLLNTRWIITDKQFDVWIDDIFYDLQFPARLSSGQMISIANEAGERRSRGAGETGVQSEALPGHAGLEDQAIPDFPATAIGLVSHLEGGANLSGGTSVAEVSLTFADGSSQTITLKAGLDTAEGNYPDNAAHPQARIGVAWPYEADGADYVAVYPLTESQAASRRVTRISVTATLPTDQFVLLRHREEHVGPISAGQPSPNDQVEITSYQPERVEIATSLDSSGWLVLTDAYYPGWQATIDDQPAEILQVNIMFRAVEVPAGEHTVVFEFRPRSLTRGLWISSVAWLLLGVGLALTVRGDGRL
ncbi:MAG: YfhO family protein, partial [Chloroflexi bacterium]|nr:YfhO family protein [Chloroflexota bacterium]